MANMALAFSTEAGDNLRRLSPPYPEREFFSSPIHKAFYRSAIVPLPRGFGGAVALATLAALSCVHTKFFLIGAGLFGAKYVYDRMGRWMIGKGTYATPERRAFIRCPNSERKNDNLSQNLTFTRFSLRVDGQLIDGYKVENREAGASRWAIATLGEGRLLEEELFSEGSTMLKAFSKGYGVNLFAINHPGLGCSEGNSSLQNMANCSRALTEYVVDFLGTISKKKKLVFLGQGTIGTAVQSEVLQDFQSPMDVSCYSLKINTCNSVLQYAQKALVHALRRITGRDLSAWSFSLSGMLLVPSVFFRWYTPFSTFFVPSNPRDKA
ncbi:MAG: hypothetical protein AAGF04_02760 [Chlamydiota bacterium]